MQKDKYYNYIYLDPTKPIEYKIKGLDIILKYEPFYVGKGCGNRSHRHLSGYSGKFMKNKIKSLLKNNINPIILKINSDISNYEACENEKYLIKVIGRRDLGLGTLCNLTDGGEGTSGAVVSIETRTKRSKKLKGRIFLPETLKRMSKAKIGKIPSLETKLKMQISRKGRTPSLGMKHTILSKNKISKSLTGRKNNKQTIEKMRLVQSKNKIVLQYDLNLNLINEFYSIAEASRKTNSIVAKICMVCKGKRKTHNNYIWKYKD